ncbi:Hypothetical predicted protein [Olea europaea subsp. europaea]|uniref:Uncharacterized protein n=1 Tax=Olea europaea subsp. europaea TaxID=158383 RepID=A0A8S0QYQ0_OLEEU|nr:Hypothetical predicted protein [Olea europaea subsp. europaea]
MDSKAQLTDTLISRTALPLYSGRHAIEHISTHLFTFVDRWGFSKVYGNSTIHRNSSAAATTYRRTGFTNVQEAQRPTSWFQQEAIDETMGKDPLCVCVCVCVCVY